MLQTRSGRCPNCKEEVLPGAEVCVNCGHKLDWNHPANATRPAAAPRPAANTARSTPAASRGVTTHTAVEWLAYLVGAALLIFLAMFVRNQFFQNQSGAEPEAPHAVRVMDAEKFREQIFATRRAPESRESAYVLGVAMPAGSDVLEITVANDWKTLNYATRSRYAAILAERWKRIHAPHRSYFTLLDQNGEEIGGRGLSGQVWVQEKHDFVRRTKPAATKSTPAGNSATPAKAAR